VPEIHCQLNYSTKLDRLIGGDFVRDMGGRVAKSLLMPSDRAKLLAANTQQLEESYHQTFPDEPTPFPMVLAVISVPAFPAAVDGQQQMVPVDYLFRLEQLASAPQEFRDLAQALVVPPDTSTVIDQMPGGAPECATFTKQLFRIVHCGHRSSFTFSRAGGCNLRPESIAPTGKLNDLYFLTQLPSASNSVELRTRQRSDLLNALSTLMTIGSTVGAPLGDIFMHAAKTYAGTMPAALSASVTKAARALGGSFVSSRDKSEAAMELADAMMDARLLS
jgi:hypothetical protein